MSNVPIAMIKEGITRGMMIDFKALKKSFPINETYITSLLDHSSSLLALRITPSMTPAITPQKVAIKMLTYDKDNAKEKARRR